MTYFDFRLSYDVTMTFYNLPDTKVTVEYNKNVNMLTLDNLPEEGVLIDRGPGEPGKMVIRW